MTSKGLLVAMCTVGILSLAAQAQSAKTAAPQGATPAGTKWALLIGINTYQPAGSTAQHQAGCVSGRCDVEMYQNLEGPLNDVALIRDVLSSAKFGFDAKNIVVLTNPDLAKTGQGFVTLPASQTDHEGILAAMRKYLVELPRKGDTVVFYYAGHGSLRVNSKGTKLPFLAAGKQTHVDSTLVPADAWTGRHDIRDRELTDIFNAALDKGIHLTVLMDSCHSGSFTRGVELGKKATERALAFDPDDVADAAERPKPTEHKENPALVFSAAEQDESAQEMPFTGANEDGKVHGVFTLALAKALTALPANAPAETVYRQVLAVMESKRGDQAPSLDAAKERLAQPLFGGAARGAGGITAAVVAVDSAGRVELDAGKLAGFDVGSEFALETTDKDGKAFEIRLHVDGMDGITHANATVKSPVSAKVWVGQIFTLKKWVPSPLNTLHFWAWPHNLGFAVIQAALTAVKASGFEPVDDPVEKPWTDMLAWNGTAWELRHAASAPKGTAATTPLGTQLTADALKSHLATGAALWVNLPPPEELFDKLALAASGSPVSGSLVVGVDDPTVADYLLAGSVGNGVPRWAWFHKPEYDAGPREKETHDHSPGCSTQSSYPVSSDWLTAADADGAAEAGAKLHKDAARLVKVNGWLNLAEHQDGDFSGDYYQLVFRRKADNTVLKAGDAAKEGESLVAYLSSDEMVDDPRWVYVLDIDCQGNGTLLYPRDTADNQFPNNSDLPHEFPLPGAPSMTVSSPYGVDTVLLITTKTQLPDPYMLDFQGVGSRGTRGIDSPLQQLLSGASAGTRGPVGDIPTEWSVVPLKLRSVPQQSQ
jgi:hypothetical protein